MLMPEEKLAVEIGKIDCVQVDDMYLTKASEGKILKDFTTDAPGADEKDFGLR